MQHNPAMLEVSRNFPLPSERKLKSTDEDPKLIGYPPSRDKTESDKSMTDLDKLPTRNKLRQPDEISFGLK